jgi:hypothetical protein
LFLFILSTGNRVFSQEVNPEIQQMTQEVIKWTQEQFQKYGTIDQRKLDSMNLKIREKQNELNSKKVVNLQAGDTVSGKVIHVAMTQGNIITVPEGKIWKVKRVTCQMGMGEYSVLVNSVKFKEKYLAGEKIVMPAFTPEASLLTSEMNVISYNFDIIESDIK